MSSLPYITLEVPWIKAKMCHTTCGTYMNWTELCEEYKIVVQHKLFIYVCTIAKEDPRSEDQADFEDNYKV